MNELNTYKVYTTTPRGAFKEVYKGDSEEEALKAYDKLLDANKPRLLVEDGKDKMYWGI